jgi:hypothetical protein
MLLVFARAAPLRRRTFQPSLACEISEVDHLGRLGFTELEVYW